MTTYTPADGYEGTGGRRSNNVILIIDYDFYRFSLKISENPELLIINLSITYIYFFKPADGLP